MSGRFVSHALRATIIVVISAAGLGLTMGSAAADPAEAKKIFTTRCMACHTFGKGVKVGPDLKGVNDRRQRAWILKFVKQSSAVIASGDATANELFQQFNQQRMPDWIDLSDDQINSILDWLAVNGPDQQEPDARAAESATLSEIEKGRQLFHGQIAFASGGAACTSCHSIRDGGGAVGGSLAADLTDTYTQYQDGGMAQFLKHPCFQRLPESASAAFLTSPEQFFLKSYLRQSVLDDRANGVAVVGATVAKPVDPPGPGGQGAAAAPGKAAAPPRVAGGATQRVAWTPKAAEMSAAAAPPRGVRTQGKLLFAAFPYVAVLVLVLGLGIRYAAARRRPDQADAAARAAWQLFSGRAAWRIGIAITLILHGLGLVLPSGIQAWNGAPMRLYLLEGSGFLFGAVAVFGWGQVMVRYLGQQRGGATDLSDGVVLSLLGVAVVSGLVTAVLYRWGSAWAVGTVTPYVRSLATGAPATALIEELPFMVRLHTLSWFAVILLVPATSAALVIVAVVHRVLTAIARPIDAFAVAGRRAATRLSPARWLWPEEDAAEVIESGTHMSRAE